MTGIWNFVTSVDFNRALMSGHILLEIRMKKMMKPYTLQALEGLGESRPVLLYVYRILFGFVT